jgi:hypothetical protein
MSRPQDPVRDVIMTLRARIADYRGRGLYDGYPDSFRCIFLHVPKTAGSSIARVLFGEESRHVPYFEYERANPHKFRSYFKFAFVRNPWDRLVSTWSFLRAGGMNEVDRAWAAQHLAAYPSFDEFVRRGLGEESIMRFPHFRPQTYYVADRNGGVTDFLGRYESLTVDFAEVARRLGKSGPLPMHNKSEHAHFSTYYHPETRDIVGRIYARDAELFGYRFEG